MIFSGQQNEIETAIEQIKSGRHWFFCDKCKINHATQYKRLRLPTKEQAVACLCDSCEIPESEYERRAGH